MKQSAEEKRMAGMALKVIVIDTISRDDASQSHYVLALSNKLLLGFTTVALIDDHTNRPENYTHCIKKVQNPNMTVM